MSGNKDNIEMAVRLASKVAECGGRAYYVGGCVRDELMGRDIKDIDIEVHRLEYGRLRELLESLGNVRVSGASFGVFGLKGYDLDIAMPRKERATGRGHKDFEIDVDPYVGEKQAAERRDFTVNAMLKDILTGEILDFFNGRGDIEDKILRHVNNCSFPEDPLRVLRAAQFAARLDFDIAPETVQLCSEMDLSGLSKERVNEELKKALLSSDKPSVFFEGLRLMKQLSFWFPEAEALIAVEQNPVYHPEGDVWNHTMLTLDKAAALRNEAKEPYCFMMSALCHDFGKVLTTEMVNGSLHAYRHETAGLVSVRSFIKRLSAENRLMRYVLNMTELHMRPNAMPEKGTAAKAYMKLFDASICPEDLLLLSKADFLGCMTDEKAYSSKERFLREKLQAYRELMSQPYLQAADLIKAGIQPGPILGEALAYSHKLRLAGINKAEALTQVLGYVRTLNKHKPGI